MFLPSGYSKNKEPLYGYGEIKRYSNKYQNDFILYNQFIKINEDPNTDNKNIFFHTDNHHYYLHFVSQNKEVFKKNITGTYESIGILKQSQRDFGYKLETDYNLLIFLDEQYLYYMHVSGINRFYFEFSTHPRMDRTYYKYTFNRFYLATSKNEEININLFLEKLNLYDETVKKS